MENDYWQEDLVTEEGLEETRQLISDTLNSVTDEPNQFIWKLILRLHDTIMEQQKLINSLQSKLHGNGIY